MRYLEPAAPGRRRGDIILVVTLVILGVLATSASRDLQNRIEAVVRGTALYPFLELHRTWAERSAVGRRAVELQTERDSLVALVTRYRTAAEQSAELRAMAALEPPELGEVVAAEIYAGRPRVGDPDVFVLRGAGLSDLEFPTGVFTGRGLLGVARAVHGSGARGEFWTHPDFRASVVTEDGSVSGIVRAVVRESEGDQPILLLDGAPFQSDIPDGMRLLTTGIAGVHPPGVEVGTVRGLAEEEAGWMKRYFVEPAVRPAETRIALVWRRPPTDSLLARFARDSADAALEPDTLDSVPGLDGAETTPVVGDSSGAGPDAGDGPVARPAADGAS